MNETVSHVIDGLLDEIADRVIKKISASNSTWLNNIQYKVRAENIEGQIQASQIDGLEDLVHDEVHSLKDNITEWAADAAENVIKEASFEVSVST